MSLPPSAHLGAVTRSLTTVERDGHSMRQLVAERTFSATAHEVWDAVTSAARIPRWLMPVSGDLRLGGRYQLEGNAGGEVLACEPPRSLSVTWEFGGQVTWVDADLTESEGTTTLVLRHTAPVDPAMWDEFGPGAVGVGWESMLLGLAQHLADPAAEPAADALAALATPDGRAWFAEFMAGSSEGWVAANIVAGADPEAARAAGERTTAAYTSEPEG